MIGSWSRRAALTSCLACLVALSAAATASAATFSNATPISIPAQGTATPYPSPIVVSGLSGSTTDVNVTLTGFTHAAPWDVAVVLVPPSGESMLLMDGPGDETNVSNVNLTFDDAAPARLPNAGAFPSGSYKPTAYFLDNFPAPGPGRNYCNPGPREGGTCTLAAALNGFNPNGTWHLYVVDPFQNDAGSIAGGWSLDIIAGGTQRGLIVSKGGTGSGTVTGTGINCGPDCAAAFDSGSPVVLTATPAVGSAFAGWTGCDTVNPNNTCTMTINDHKNVTANFTANPPKTLTVIKAGAGSGTVTAPAQAVPGHPPQPGIDCGTDCTEAYNGGSSAVLTAVPAGGFRFVGWTGCDSPAGNTCTMSMTADKSVTAIFEPVTPPATTPPPQAPIPTPGGGSATAAPVAPPDFPGPPRLELGGPPTQKLRSVIEVTAEADEAATLEADGTIAAPRIVARLGAAQRRAKTFRLPGVCTDAPARTRVTLRVPVPRKAVSAIKARLKRGRRGTARIRVVATDRAGDRRTGFRTIRIKR